MRHLFFAGNSLEILVHLNVNWFFNEDIVLNDVFDVA